MDGWMNEKLNEWTKGKPTVKIQGRFEVKNERANKKKNEWLKQKKMTNGRKK